MTNSPRAPGGLSLSCGLSKLKGDFPILSRTVHGHQVVYLDSAASAQRPQCVLDAMDVYYQTTHANVHRGVYTFAEEADRLYDAARVAVGRFIGAPDPEHEVIFTKNATESVNLVAATWGRANLGRGDVVLLTDMEHHANIVPWLMLAEERGSSCAGSVSTRSTGSTSRTSSGSSTV